MDNREHEQRVREYYAPLLAEYGDEPAVVGYPEPAGQQGRYAILTEVGDLSTASVLDIGCGVGHLLDFLRAKGFGGAYLGIDLQGEMVERARRRHPDARFERVDFLATPGEPGEHDFVLASGVMQHGDEATMRRMIEAMYAHCRVAAAFNAFSDWYPDHREPRFHIADPIATLDFCRGITPRVLFRHEYVAHDFTIYMYRP